MAPVCQRWNDWIFEFAKGAFVGVEHHEGGEAAVSLLMDIVARGHHIEHALEFRS
jgi:hypothetical protein